MVDLVDSAIFHLALAFVLDPRLSAFVFLGLTLSA
jgi:hypothetical protein